MSNVSGVIKSIQDIMRKDVGVEMAERPTHKSIGLAIIFKNY